MKAMSNTEFAEFAKSLAKPVEKFEPTAIYDMDGDCIEFIAKPDSFYAERIDELVTVYYSHETNQIIGSLIKGVDKFCKEMLVRFPGFKIEIHDRRVKIEHIFLAKLWSEPPATSTMAVLAYKKLIEVAEETRTEARLLCEV